MASLQLIEPEILMESWPVEIIGAPSEEVMFVKIGLMQENNAAKKYDISRNDYLLLTPRHAEVSLNSKIQDHCWVVIYQIFRQHFDKRHYPTNLESVWKSGMIERSIGIAKLTL